MHDVIEIEKRYQKARDLVGKLCTREERWTMSIPVNQDRDTDIILASSLEDIPVLIQKLFEARSTQRAG